MLKSHERISGAPDLQLWAADSQKTPRPNLDMRECLFLRGKEPISEEALLLEVTPVCHSCSEYGAEHFAAAAEQLRPLTGWPGEAIGLGRECSLFVVQRK